MIDEKEKVVDVVEPEEEGFADEGNVEIVEPETVVEPVSEEEENDFVDDSSEKKLEERKKIQEEEAAVAEAAKKAEEEAAKKKQASALQLEESLRGGESPVFIAPGDKYVFEYDNKLLEDIEKARAVWAKGSRLGSIIKVIVSVVALSAIIIGWVIPANVLGPDAGQTPLYVALGCAGGAVAVMFITSMLIKHRNKGLVADYFRGFYAGFDGYAFEGLDIDNITGNVEQKISKEEFEAGKIFLNTHSVGSRDSHSFTYKKVDCALCDAAGQEERSDRTVAVSFVGKYLRMHNHANVSEDGVIIYVKGNERAIPPSAILQREPAIEKPRYNVYGSMKDINNIPAEFMEKVEGIRTDKLLIDVTISIQKGRTYFYIGYEDTLMILPNRDHFNPNYLIAYKGHLANFLEMGILI